jgi:hypothetical protein
VNDLLCRPAVAHHPRNTLIRSSGLSLPTFPHISILSKIRMRGNKGVGHDLKTHGTAHYGNAPFQGNFFQAVFILLHILKN